MTSEGSCITGLTAGAMYWTSTAAGTRQAVARGLNEYNPSVSRYEAARGNAFGVRCLKDQVYEDDLLWLIELNDP